MIVILNMKTSELLSIIDLVRNHVDFARVVSHKLASFRFVHESDSATFDRILKTASKIICKKCRGDGDEGILTRRTCSECHGLGEVAYNPMEKVVKEIHDE